MEYKELVDLSLPSLVDIMLCEMPDIHFVELPDSTYISLCSSSLRSEANIQGSALVAHLPNCVPAHS